MSTPPRTLVFEHVGVTVTDLDRSVAFYTGVFGFSILRRTTMNAYLHLGDELLELVLATEPRLPELPDGDEAWRDEMFRSVGLNHIGFRVDDMDAAITEIEARGGRLVVPPWDFTPHIEHVVDHDVDKLFRAGRPRRGDSWRVAVFADPDGTMLELLER
ncbi:MAG: VOC family protein [Gaiellaceae bacterium]